MSDVKLPETVRVCSLCSGEGEYEQRYTAGCGMGSYMSMGKCDLCNGTRYLYKDTSTPVPESVVNQIEVMNGG